MLHRSQCKYNVHNKTTITLIQARFRYINIQPTTVRLCVYILTCKVHG